MMQFSESGYTLICGREGNKKIRLKPDFRIFLIAQTEADGSVCGSWTISAHCGFALENVD